MRLLFFIGHHLYLRGIWWSSYSSVAPRRRVLQWDWTMCSKCRHHSRFSSEHNWKTSSLIQKHLDWKLISASESYNICNSTSILKLDITIFSHVLVEWDMSQANPTTLNVCEVPIIVPQTIDHTNLKSHENDFVHFRLSEYERYSTSGANTSRDVVVSWPNNSTRSNHNGMSPCHCHHFVLNCWVMKLPQFY